MTSAQADTMIQLQQQTMMYCADMQLNSGQNLAFVAALHQGLLILAGFVIIIGIVLITQSRPRSG